MILRGLIVFGALALSGCALLSPPAPQRPAMIVAGDPRAAEAGARMLARGGSAVDAAIAAQMVLGLVEPQSSGLGGGAFLLHWDARTARLASHDGRETAPAAATPDMFLDPDGQPVAFFDAVAGGTSVGVPGLVAVLADAHAAHGRLPWAELFAPAIALAEDGFTVSPRLAMLLARVPHWRTDPAARALFTIDGRTAEAGDRLTNQAYAATLRALAADPRAVYEGAIADAVVAAVRGVHNRPQAMTADDLAGYRAIVREPLCAPFRRLRVCTMGPPGSGGIGVLQVLGLIARTAPQGLDLDTVEGVHLFAEALRLAYADRAIFLADPDFVPVPAAALLSPAYLDARAERIDPARSTGPARAGEPEGQAAPFAPHAATDWTGTSHLSAVDGFGNAVAMTSTIEFAFGSGIAAAGFLLNNQLTDFSFTHSAGGKPIANSVAPGKRPRSTMAPVIVFGADAMPVLIAGSPGGGRILAYVAGFLLRYLEHGDAARAVAGGHIADVNQGALEIEAGTGLEALRAALTARGHNVEAKTMTSGLNVIALTPAGPAGAADPRREGAVAAVPAASD